MATADEIREAITCLSTVYPQYVQNELANLTDQIQATVQGFTDPLQALGDLNIQSLIESAADLGLDNTEDAFTNVAKAAVGLTSQYVRREVEEIDQAAIAASQATKRIQEVAVLGDKLLQRAITTMSIFPDLPYAAAQRVCSLINGLVDVKIANLECLQKHVTQLLNAVLVLVDTQANFKEDTLDDLATARGFVVEAYNELVKSILISNGNVSFDSEAFARARENLITASRTIAPPTAETTILDVSGILTSGSIGQGYADRSNQALVHIIIPSLTNLIELEVQAYVAQVSSINFFVGILASIIENYEGVGNSSKVATQRARVIADLQNRLLVMAAAMDRALERDSTRLASGQMLLWTSRIRSVISSMDEVGQLTLEVGSPGGADDALALANGLSDLVTALTSFQSDKISDGIEDATQIRDQVNSLTVMAKNVAAIISDGNQTANQLATLHALGAQVGQDQLGFITDSIALATTQRAACNEFLAFEVISREQFSTLLNSMRQVGFDRGVDLLGSGRFQEFLNSDLERLSYTGAAVNCLTEALSGIDDTQTRRRILDIRDNLIAKRNNIELAAADASDIGLQRFLGTIESEIFEIQRNAKIVESIVTDLELMLERLGEIRDEAADTITDFISSVNRLSVNAGGRLAEVLEERSSFANAGVVRCE